MSAVTMDPRERQLRLPLIDAGERAAELLADERVQERLAQAAAEGCAVALSRERRELVEAMLTAALPMLRAVIRDEIAALGVDVDLGVEEAAALLGMSRRTFERREGLPPGRRGARGQMFYSRRALLAWRDKEQSDAH